MPLFLTGELSHQFVVVSGFSFFPVNDMLSLHKYIKSNVKQVSSHEDSNKSL